MAAAPLPVEVIPDRDEAIERAAGGSEDEPDDDDVRFLEEEAERVAAAEEARRRDEESAYEQAENERRMIQELEEREEAIKKAEAEVRVAREEAAEHLRTLATRARETGQGRSDGNVTPLSAAMSAMMGFFKPIAERLGASAAAARQAVEALQQNGIEVDRIRARDMNTRVHVWFSVVRRSPPLISWILLISNGAAGSSPA